MNEESLNTKSWADEMADEDMESAVAKKLETGLKMPSGEKEQEETQQQQQDEEPEPVMEIKEVSGLVESVHSVQVKLADQQANEASPLFSVHSFEELGL